MTKRRILLPISGLLGGVVKNLYDDCSNMEHGLRAEFPKKKILFVGTPFPNELFPLLPGAPYRDRYPEEQVILSWGLKTRFLIALKKLIEEQDPDVIVTRRLGLDIALLIAECLEWDKRWKSALRIHFGLVDKVLLGELKLQIPDAYIIPTASNGTLRAALLETFPELKHVPGEVIEEFLTRQKTAKDFYFDGTGQHPPFPVDAAKSRREMYQAVVGFVRRQIDLYQ